MSTRRKKSAKRETAGVWDGSGRPVASAKTLAQALKDGHTVLALRGEPPWAADAAEQIRGEHQERVAALPSLLDEIRELLVAVDRFTAMTQVLIWLAYSPATDLVAPPIEFVAAVALEHPTRASAGCDELGLDVAALERLTEALLELMVLTPEALVLASGEAWSEHEILRRFLIQQLTRPTFASDSQERRLVEGMAVDGRLAAALREHVGLDCHSALQCYDALRSRTENAQASYRETIAGRSAAEAGALLSGHFRFTEADLCAQGTEPEHAQRFCEIYSQPLGTHATPLPGLTAGLRARPILRDADGVMILTHLPLLLRALRPALRLASNPDTRVGGGSQAAFGLWVKRENHLVGADVERAVGEHLRAAQVGREARWRSSSDNSDLDVWAHQEGHLLSVQVKAGKRRPVDAENAKALLGDIKKLVTDAIEQNDRFERARGAGLQWVSQRKAPPLQAADSLASVVLTLDDMSACAVISAQLRDAGLTSTAKLPWIVNLAHFEQVLELLDSPALFLDFLRRRQQLSERQVLLSTDEIDFALRYLTTGLGIVDLDEPTYEGHAVREMAGKPALTDQYYAWLLSREGVGDPTPKPSLAPGKFAALLRRLDRDRPTGFLELSLALLELPRGDWEYVDRALLAVYDAPAVEKQGSGVDLLFESNPSGPLGFTLMLQSRNSRWDWSSELAARCHMCRGKYGIDRWYGLAIPLVAEQRLRNLVLPSEGQG
jgi:hypothetical protein